MSVCTRFVLTLLLACGFALPAGEVFSFTVIPDQDSTRLAERFGRLATHLSTVLGREVRFVPVKTYAAAVEAFASNDVQLAWFGGLTGVQARRAVPGSVAIAQGREDLAFTTYFIAHRSAGLSPGPDFPAAIAGKTFTFGSKGSTSGRLMPEHFIRTHFNQTPEQVFSRVGFSGDHSATIQLVQSGSWQVGAVNYAVWDAELAAGRINSADVQIIWRTPAYADYNWTIRGDVPEALREAVTRAILSLEDPELLAAFPRSAFVPARNEDYADLVRVAITTGLLREE